MIKIYKVQTNAWFVEHDCIFLVGSSEKHLFSFYSTVLSTEYPQRSSFCTNRRHKKKNSKICFLSRSNKCWMCQHDDCAKWNKSVSRDNFKNLLFEIEKTANHALSGIFEKVKEQNKILFFFYFEALKSLVSL